MYAGFQRVAILGTGLIGSSLALALKAGKNPPQVTGFDLNADSRRGAGGLKTAGGAKAFDRLTGNLAQSEARAIVLTATLGRFPPVRLAFAWTRNNLVPVILGQVNFFMEFDVCFYRSRLAFEIKPKG